MKMENSKQIDTWCCAVGTPGPGRNLILFAYVCYQKQTFSISWGILVVRVSMCCRCRKINHNLNCLHSSAGNDVMFVEI